MAQSNGFISTGYEESEDKSMLLTKKSGDGHGITALINRQLQGILLYIFFYKTIKFQLVVDVINV